MTETMPIKDFTEKFLQAVKENGYSKSREFSFRGTLKRLLAYASQKGVLEYSIDFGYAFLRDNYPEAYNKATAEKLPNACVSALRTIKMLNDLHVHGIIIKKRHSFSQQGLTESERQLLTNFENHYETVLSKRSANRISGDMKMFLRYLHSINTDLAGISEKTLIGFMQTVLPYSKAQIETKLYSLRKFVKYLFDTGLVPINLTENIPVPKKVKNPYIPSVWKPSDVQKILDAVDRGSPVGKRDYAILMLVTHLGLRISDVKNMKISNFDWDKNKLDLCQSKTGKPLSLPLLPEVGWAIIDYLKDGRPKTDIPNVFLTASVPVQALSESSSMANIIIKYAHIAGVKLDSDKKHGMHSLRHTLASKLLEAKTPLPIISEVLGHSSSHEVDAYLKVDIESLRKCALNPEEVFSVAICN
jgi:site-specific recombinase XerD